jgi:glycosyltransferase involved in cell wall biosynthesis
MPTVSVVLMSYNHQKYISECIYSIVAQQTKHTIELVWYDDCSTDDTVKIGTSILDPLPIEKKYIFPVNNRMSYKIFQWLSILEQCTGDYICFIEGDDFWIAKTKIENQIRLLQRSQSNICFGPSVVVDPDSKPTGKCMAFHGKKLGLFPPQAVIDGDGGFMATASICIKRSALQFFPNWFFGYLPVGDYPLQVLGSMEAGAIYYPEFTTAYRRGDPNSWTTVYETNPDPATRVGFILEYLDLILSMAQSKQLAVFSFEKIFRKYEKEAFCLAKQLSSEIYTQQISVAKLKMLQVSTKE